MTRKESPPDCEVLEFRPAFFLPEDYIAMTSPEPDITTADLVRKTNEILEKKWGYVRKEAPVLEFSDFHEVSEDWLDHPLSNRRRAQEKACRDGRSFGGLRAVEVQYAPSDYVGSSRRHGFSWTFEYKIIICIDLVEKTVTSARYNKTY